MDEHTAHEAAFQHESVQKFIDEMLERLQAQATGSATLVAKAVIATEPPSIDLGEITDKGSLNQRAVLKYRANLVEKLYG